MPPAPIRDLFYLRSPVDQTLVVFSPIWPARFKPSATTASAPICSILAASRTNGTTGIHFIPAPFQIRLTGIGLPPPVNDRDLPGDDHLDQFRDIGILHQEVDAKRLLSVSVLVFFISRLTIRAKKIPNRSRPTRRLGNRRRQAGFRHSGHAALNDRIFDTKKFCQLLISNIFLEEIFNFQFSIEC